MLLHRHSPSNNYNYTDFDTQLIVMNQKVIETHYNNIYVINPPLAGKRSGQQLLCCS